MADFTPLHRKLQLAIVAYLDSAIESTPVVAAEHDDKAPLPRIVVNCDALREVEPASGIFGGTVEITVVTSADDASVADNLAIAAAAQSELADETSVLGVLNAGAESRPISDLHLYELWPSGMRTETVDRSVRTRLDFGVVAVGRDAESPPPPCHGCDSCQVCDACESCDGCQVCDSCDQCDSCQVCNACESCDTDPCEACQICDLCQRCDACQTCDSCQVNDAPCTPCDGCDPCDPCQMCDAVCDPCQACDADCPCDAVCDPCQACDAVCDPCQACDPCDPCQPCDGCDPCDPCDGCDPCDPCQPCDGCDPCDPCQACDGEPV